MKICLVCGNEIKDDHEQFITKSGSICMGCEDSEIDIYRISLPEKSSNWYCDINISHIIDMLKDCDYGDGYTVIKEKMKALKYYNLSEFTGF